MLWPSCPFFVAAYRALRNGVLNMAALVVLSVGTGYVFSVGATFFFPGMRFALPTAAVLRDEREVELPTAEVPVGDVVAIRPGNKIPVDGEVIEGES